MCRNVQMIAATILLLVTAPLWSAVEDDLEQDIKEMQKQLEAMETKNGRNLDIFELRFFPGPLKQITINDRLGNEHVYYYMTFRVRNPGIGGENKLETEYTRYNEILQNIANEYENISIDGTTLRVETEREDDDVAVVLKRDELNSAERTVRLSITAYDENGSRIRILDRIPGQGPQEKFNFPDDGVRSVNIGVNRVREKIEEREGKRLLLTSEIAQRTLPVYQPGEMDDETRSTLGEVNGVIVFNDLSVHGDKFEIQIRGLSNKVRNRVPEHASNEIADYWNMRIYRRTYFVKYEREGDEYFRDRDAFDLVDHGWYWRNTFQRIDQRATMAHVPYFLNNLADSKGNENKEMVEKALAYYEAVREQRAELVDEQSNLSDTEQDLPDIKKLMQDGE